MKVAYLDPVCGVSGDMFVACFIDAGLALEEISEGLRLLPLGGYEISSTKVLKNSVRATRFVVHAHGPQHEHRTFRSIRSLISGSSLAEDVKESAIKTFRALAEAEAQVHGAAPEDVAFHEVGAVDSVVDIVASSLAMRATGVEELLVGPMPVGRGAVRTAHGLLPIPAPATARLLRGFEVLVTDIEGELVTPTGAAILSAHGRAAVSGAPAIRIRSVGVGAGARNVERLPNIARVFIGELSDKPGSMRPIDVIETTVDDATPEVMGYVTGLLLDGGAHDAFVTPVVMKKSRPGALLTVLSPPGATEKLVAVIFRETPTLGVRVSKQLRYELERRIETVGTEFGDVPVKISTDSEGRRRPRPEYEACASAARAKGVPLTEVWEAARRAWEKSQEA